MTKKIVAKEFCRGFEYGFFKKETIRNQVSLEKQNNTAESFIKMAGFLNILCNF
jgi:hypothetical protein